MIGFAIPVPVATSDDDDVFWPTCGLNVHPARLPVRFELPGRTFFERVTGLNWAITLYHDHMVLWREALLGVHEPLVVPMSEFESVTVRAAEDADSTFRIAIFLRNTVRGMEIPVYAADQGNDVATLWDAWGRALDLPLEIVDADGNRRTPCGTLPLQVEITRIARRVHDRRRASERRRFPSGRVNGRRLQPNGRREVDRVS